MKTKEETIIEIEKTLKEKGLFPKELSEDELAKVNGGSGVESAGYSIDQHFAYTNIYKDGATTIKVMFRIVGVSYPIVTVRFIYRVDNEPDWEGMHSTFDAHELDAMLASGEIVRIV